MTPFMCNPANCCRRLHRQLGRNMIKNIFLNLYQSKNICCAHIKYYSPLSRFPYDLRRGELVGRHGDVVYGGNYANYLDTLYLPCQQFKRYRTNFSLILCVIESHINTISVE